MKASAELGERMAVIVRGHVERQLAPLRVRITDLEQKSRDQMSFRGVYQRALCYRRGDCVVSDAALWFCARDTSGGEDKPGEGTNSPWVLTGKSR